MPIISILKFLSFLLFFLYIPGKLLFRFLKVRIDDALIDIGLATVLGIVFVTLYSIIIRSFGLNFSFLWIIFIFSTGYFLFNFNTHKFRDELRRLMRQKIKSALLLLLLVLLTGVVAQNIVLFRGGWKTSEGLIFPSLHDTMWNIALSAELLHHFPPENPAISGVLLKNNHYFYPFFLAIVRYLSGIDIFDLYFRLGPILVSILFGLGIYSVSSIFTKNIHFKTLALILGYFSGNFAYLVPPFLGVKFDWKGNTFFADQPFDQIINPYSVFGFVLMLFGIYCLSQIIKSKKPISSGYSIISGLLFGVLYGFKSFGGIIVVSTLTATFFFQIVFYRRRKFLLVTLLSIFLFSLILFLTTDFQNAALIWIPGWLLTQMMTDKDKLNLPHFADLERFYQSSGNLLGFAKIKIIELTIYLIGNLGTRLVGLVYLYTTLVRKVFEKKKEQNFLLWFITLAIIISFSIPLLFNLRNSTFNIIQFTPYGLLLLAIMSTFALETVYRFLIIKNKKTWGIIIITVFIALSIPVNVKNILSKFNPPEDLITHEEINALNWLRQNTRESDILLINPNQFSQDSIYIAAMSERRVYLASPSYAVQTGLDPKDRSNAVNEFFKNSNFDFLGEKKISYIYLLKSNLSDNSPTMLEKLGAKNVFENSKVIIWEKDK